MGQDQVFGGVSVHIHNYRSLNVTITSIECRACFHFYGASRAARNREQAKRTK